MLTTSLLVIFVLLIIPVIGPALYPIPRPLHQALYNVTVSVKLAFYVSLFPIFLLLSQGTETVVTSWDWVSVNAFTITLSLKFDSYSTIFISVALYITWSILQFSNWYMHNDPSVERFFKYLLMFLLIMFILITANNMFQIFIGWEGVGIISFLLIGWWSGRGDANTAATQAMLYNRVADMGLIFAIAWIAVYLHSWDLDRIYPIGASIDITYPIMGVILAATGKSAQFGLHPWLPSAMEGPTPVSALLHSSTMVVAGIFLLIRIAPLMEQNKFALSFCLCLGALTTLFTALCALTQNDIKKIIAYSTCSQLGLIIVTLGIGQPKLAFLHICTHAFSKAILFLCSGSVIHSLNDEQDIRKIGAIHRLTPITSSCTILGALALAGTPFLSAYYSKDLILETLVTSYVNAWALALTMLATACTAIYSLRVVYYVLVGLPRFSPLSPINENDKSICNSIKRLAWGTIVAGLCLSLNITIPKVPAVTLPPALKLAALVFTLTGLYIAMDLAQLANKQYQINPYKTPHHFSNMLGYFPVITHRLPIKLTLILGRIFAFQTVDQTWLEKSGPQAIVNTTIPLIATTSSMQGGKVKTFLAFFLITLILALVLLVLRPTARYLGQTLVPPLIPQTKSKGAPTPQQGASIHLMRTLPPLLKGQPCQ